MTNLNPNSSGNSRTTEFNQIIKRLSDFYKKPTINLMNHLVHNHHYSLDQIASIVGLSKQAISTNYLPSEQNADSKATKSKSKGSHK